MKRILSALALILGLCPNTTLADFNATAGSGLVIFGFTCFSTKVCTAWVPINSAGTELFTGANPGIATGSGTAGTAATGVLTVQGIASMTPLLAAQSGTWNITNISGTISLPTGAATAANQATEISSLATIATNTGAAVPAGTARIGYVSDDPCTQLTKTNLAIGTATGTTQLVAPSGITQVYVCSFSLISASTAVVNLVGGTGATCTTGTPVAMVGSTTAASGMSLAANGGLTFGNGGATAARTTTAGHGVCLIQSGTTALAGNITYVQQ